MTPYALIENKVLNSNTLDEIAEGLEILFSNGFSVGEDGNLYSIKQQVGRVNGLKIEIYPNEHPPPHFHVKTGDVSASFSIDDCQLLEGKVGHREKALINWWYVRSRKVLVKTWNDTRPTDCKVGPIIN